MGLVKKDSLKAGRQYREGLDTSFIGTPAFELESEARSGFGYCAFVKV